MGLISRAWTNLGTPGAMSVDLTRPPVNDEPSILIQVSDDDLLWVNGVVLAAVRPFPASPKSEIFPVDVDFLTRRHRMRFA
jgi:hypothetical protein